MPSLMNSTRLAPEIMAKEFLESAITIGGWITPFRLKESRNSAGITLYSQGWRFQSVEKLIEFRGIDWWERYMVHTLKGKSRSYLMIYRKQFNYPRYNNSHLG